MSALFRTDPVQYEYAPFSGQHCAQTSRCKLRAVYSHGGLDALAWATISSPQLTISEYTKGVLESFSIGTSYYWHESVSAYNEIKALRSVKSVD